ncbi:two-component system, chemotaxis family, response regulator CheB [Oceanobacillus limi]|uniref:Protein-glutamate methylesterase/protein-glutamine glutaminase n=1 Tax=Oceanobacillus limi TaxID=930131 RepID=A0A1H9Z3T6_9BACI|nr:chemotaxis response regulator protein-glutamate methylesterase [Oceanobacillus limi]SES75673.1 two-component system, chemotaxis family, response regulator CheB [Oceanobacillus limi]
MNSIRVIVIDDSAFMRKMISDILESDKRIEVIATARNGKEGIEKIKKLQPDVVTLDVEMPIMDGMTALLEIMNNNPVPVVMLSSLTSEGASKTLQAISNGAVDFIAKPSGSISLDIQTINQEIIEKVVAASQAQLTKSNTTKPIQPDLNQVQHTHHKSIIAIGSSTGGPRALQHVLTELPKDFKAPILIAQHMPKGFTKSLADRLNALSNIHVKEAVHGEIIKENTAYIAPGNHHMKIRSMGISHTIEITEEKLGYLYRPSVDVLFESLAQIKKINKLAVVLTGMGSDGAKGILYLKEKDPNSIVIAESEESSVVYGMPKAAVKTNAVDYNSHIQQIGSMINKITKG